MVDIDLKDRKILYQLDLNCRQSNVQIGRKVGLSKQVVDYRIKKMEEEKIIVGYSSLIDIFKLGYHVYRLYLKLQDISQETKKELIDELMNYKNTWVVYTTVGNFDIGSIFFVNNVYDFYNFYNNLLNVYGKFLNDRIISIYVKAVEYEKSYLLSNEDSKNSRKSYSIVCDGTHYTVDIIDYQIMNEIILNARAPLIELAHKVHSTSQTVNLRIQKMIKHGIIQNFRVDIDFSKLGLKYFYILISLKENSKRKEIIEYITRLPSFKCLNVAIGYTDLDVEFIYPSMDDMTELLDELENKFPNAIRKYYFHKNKVIFLERWLPKMDFKK